MYEIIWYEQVRSPCRLWKFSEYSTFSCLSFWLVMFLTVSNRWGSSTVNVFLYFRNAFSCFYVISSICSVSLIEFFRFTPFDFFPWLFLNTCFKNNGWNTYWGVNSLVWCVEMCICNLFHQSFQAVQNKMCSVFLPKTHLL